MLHWDNVRCVGWEAVQCWKGVELSVKEWGGTGKGVKEMGGSGRSLGRWNGVRRDVKVLGRAGEEGQGGAW